jgi:hypothetical protein
MWGLDQWQGCIQHSRIHWFFYGLVMIHRSCTWVLLLSPFHWLFLVVSAFPICWGVEKCSNGAEQDEEKVPVSELHGGCWDVEGVGQGTSNMLAWGGGGNVGALLVGCCARRMGWVCAQAQKFHGREDSWVTLAALGAGTLFAFWFVLLLNEALMRTIRTKKRLHEWSPPFLMSLL